MPSKFVNQIYTFNLKIKLLFIFCSFNYFCLFAQTKNGIKSKQILDTNALKFPFKDRRTPSFQLKSQNPFEIIDTHLIKQQINYNPKTKQFAVSEKIGNGYYRRPINFSFDEFWKLQNQKSERDYFSKRSLALYELNKKVKRPKFIIDDSYYENKLFYNNSESNLGKSFSNIQSTVKEIGGTVKSIQKTKQEDFKVDIQAVGEISVVMGYVGSKSYNPNIPEIQRSISNFDFKPNYNVNLNAKIGDNFKLPVNLSNISNFQLDNDFKLSFTGRRNQIIKTIEAGNISFQSKSTLIPGTQNLIGIKSRLQFGKLFATVVLANQRSNRESINLQGGSTLKKFSKQINDYDENKHFLLGSYFKEHFSEVMGTLPQPNSKVIIQKVELWVTNKNNATSDVRNVLGFMDLGESNPYKKSLNNGYNSYPDNNANDLYSFLLQNQNIRNPAQSINILTASGYKPVEDYMQTYARKLNSNEFYFNAQAGFVSLNFQLLPDEILGVAYQFTYNGKTFQVGEFSTDAPPDPITGAKKTLYLKMLKSTSQRIDLPIWKLMMKNVYSLDISSQIQPQDFQLNIYYNDPGAGLKRNLPVSDPATNGKSLIRILNLDNLNTNNNPQPDGVFDFVPGYTILPQTGKIIFPFLEPFGKDLEKTAFSTLPDSIRKKYIYYQLYDSLKIFAQSLAQLDRYSIQGQVKGTNGEFYINSFNLPPGSVIIQVGGQKLIEGTDYTIDYGSGRGRIINPAYLNNASSATVSFENNNTYTTQQKGFTAVRLDYIENENLLFGFTYVSLGGTPFFNKLNYGDDPVQNSVYGLDFSYKGEVPIVTKILNKLPFYSSKAKSFFNTYAEFAYFNPGHPSVIGSTGVVYIDDFESASSIIDLKEPSFNWTLASVPQGQQDLFPEASDTSLVNNFNRAKIAWYKIQPNLQDPNDNTNPLRANVNELSDPRIRLIKRNEIFPVSGTDLSSLSLSFLQTFDLAYYPKNRGPYNFNTSLQQLDASGNFINPSTKWAGIMRSIEQNDFEASNIGYLEFWVLDPFINNPNNSGNLYINLGDISEDVLKDGKKSYENGLPTPNFLALLDTSIWGYIPQNPIQLNNAFSNNVSDREFQDIGFDGLNDEQERRFYKNFLDKVQNNFGTNSVFYQNILNDPGNDDYTWFLDPQFDSRNVGLLNRYKNYNNPQGNSSVVSTNSNQIQAATTIPDKEDLNNDNTINETEAYFQYKIPLTNGLNTQNSPFINDVRTANFVAANGSQRSEKWYQFRIPIQNFEKKVGAIKDFKSIRFIRMFLKDFSDSIVLRLATLQFTRNNWRPFTYEIDTNAGYKPADNNSNLVLGTINYYENSNRSPVNYLIPPNIQQVQTVSSLNTTLLLNEQSLSLKIDNLAPNKNRGIYKVSNFDFRRYKKMLMFTHIESRNYSDIRDGYLEAVIRIGQDYLDNYYEIRIPLKITQPDNNIKDANIVWPTDNNLDFDFDELINLKLERNKNRALLNKIYRKKIGNKTFSVFGNPNIAEVRAILLGVENVSENNISAEVWFDELRLSDFNENGSWAGLARVDAILADLGTVNISTNFKSTGFGSVEQNINQRALYSTYQLNFATNLELGKLLPAKLKISIPFTASINQTILTPDYNPFDQDITVQQSLNQSQNKDSIKSLIIDETTNTNIGINNLRILEKSKSFISISNFDISYSYSKIENSSPTIALNSIDKHSGSMGYTYNIAPNYVQPLKKIIPSKIKFFAFLSEFNFNFLPSNISFRTNINRQFGVFIPRIINNFDGTADKVDTTYNKYFTINNNYTIRYNLTKSINIDYSSNTSSIVDEPFGALNNPQKKDSVFNNFIKGGRTTLYNQSVNGKYILPTKYFTLIDWINANYTYSSNFTWTAASLNATKYGNLISNDLNHSFNAQFNFDKLYNKSKFLKAVLNDKNNEDNNAQSQANTLKKPVLIPKKIALKGLTGEKRTAALTKWKQDKKNYVVALKEYKKNKPVKLGFFSRTLGGLFTIIKNGSIDYSEKYRSSIPGYVGSLQFVKNDFSGFDRNLGYVFGFQPNLNWLDERATLGYFTNNPDFNLQITQTFSQKVTLNLQIEPIPYLNINIKLNKTFTKNYSELFKDTNYTGSFQHLSPLANGGFNVSFFALNTFFDNNNINNINTLFLNFQKNRIIVAKRVAAQNPYWTNLPDNQKFAADGFPTGYNKYAQEVLIPSFIAAYTGENAHNVALIKPGKNQLSLNPFDGIIPKPNWQLTYSGFSHIKAIKEIFTSFTIRNGYTSNFELNSYSSSLLYSDPFRWGGAGFVDTVSNNFVPYFLVPNITINESLDPLIGVDIATKSATFRFEYRRSRTLTLSLIDYQVSESNMSDISFGSSYQIKNVKLPFKLPSFFGNNFKANLIAKIDISVRDSKRTNTILDQNNSIVLDGQQEITIFPSLDYVINTNFSFKLFFEQRYLTPYVSNNYPTVNTRAGISIRYTLR